MTAHLHLPVQKFHHCLAPGVLEAPSRMAYYCWGNPKSSRMAMCVHGLTRQARDFDTLAMALVKEGFFVVCTDVVGRGESEWLSNPLAYQIPSYVAHHIDLLRHLQQEQQYQETAWIGTSMGGLIGIGVCASAAAGLAPPINQLVLNDIGPKIEMQGLKRLASYVGCSMEFATEDSAIAFLKGISKEFGPHTDAQWRDLSLPMLRPNIGGGVRLHYDPSIVDAFAHIAPQAQSQGEALLWQAFASIQAKILLLRGADSDILSRAGVAQMQAVQASMQVHEFPGVGHAPTLVHAEQIAVITQFLAQHGAT